MNAEQWAKSLDANAFTVRDQWLSPNMAKEIAALLRAGIAASEECERAWLAAWDAEWRAQQAEAAEEALWVQIGESK